MLNADRSGTELIKVMTGIRRCGKSVMLELIKQELTESGVSPMQFISIKELAEAVIASALKNK